MWCCTSCQQRLALHLACTWLALGLHLVYTWSTLGLHLVYTWSTRGLQIVHTSCTLGQHGETMLNNYGTDLYQQGCYINTKQANAEPYASAGWLFSRLQCASLLLVLNYEVWIWLIIWYRCWASAYIRHWASQNCINLQAMQFHNSQ